MSKFNLNESYSLGQAVIDEPNGIIRGIKVLGEESKNGYIFPKATRTLAHSLLEGAKVNLNHLSKKDLNNDVPFQNRMGKIMNLREQDNGTFADVKLLKSNPYTAMVFEAAKDMPDACAFSIRAAASGSKKDPKGRIIVESIDKVISVDLVSDGANTLSLFESEDKMPADQAPEDTCEQAFADLISALVKENKEDFIKDAIKLKKKVLGEKDDPEEPEDPEAMSESDKSLQKELEQLKLEKSCRILCESHSLTPETPLMDALMALPDDEKRKTYLSWMKKKAPVKKPRSTDSLSLQESVTPKNETEQNQLNRLAHILRS